MFKMGLLTSTAMTAVALLLSGAPTGAYAQTNMGAVRDSNTRFLCTYGRFGVYSSSALSTYGQQRWVDVAIPVIGHGQTVSRIRVREGADSLASTSSFTVGIYKDSPSGFPSNPIAVGVGKASQTCGAVEVSIRPTTLTSNKKYWIEEQAPLAKRCRKSMWGGSDAHRREFRPTDCHVRAGAYWIANPDTKHKAWLREHWRYSASGETSSSYTSPWTKHKKGPYLTLK